MGCCKCCCEGKDPPGECCGSGAEAVCCEAGWNCCNGVCQNEPCPEDCCPCLTLTGDFGELVYQPAVSLCNDTASYQDYDSGCSVVGMGSFDGPIITGWFGPAGLGTLKPSATATYAGSTCQFAVVGAVVQRHVASEGLDGEGNCICYIIHAYTYYYKWVFIYRCSTGMWENITDEVLTTNVAMFPPDQTPSTCSESWTNGNPPPAPPDPTPPLCDGPFGGCSEALSLNEFP